MQRTPNYVPEDWKGERVHVQFKRPSSVTGQPWDVDHKTARLLEITPFGVHLEDDVVIAWDAITLIALSK